MRLVRKTASKSTHLVVSNTRSVIDVSLKSFLEEETIVMSPFQHICWVSNNSAEDFMEEMDVGKPSKFYTEIATITSKILGYKKGS